MTDLNRLIDHTLLKANLIESDVRRVCEEALHYHFHAVCLYPVWIKTAASLLAGTDIALCSVIAFPSGALVTKVKQIEAELAVHQGATELDMVANLSWLAAGEWTRFADEIKAVRDIIPEAVTLKVIIESPLLDPSQRTEAVKALLDTGAEFVKSGTGLAGAVTPTEIAQLKVAAGNLIRVKASGGIRTADQCHRLVSAGADRLGTSASVAIVTQSDVTE